MLLKIGVGKSTDMFVFSMGSPLFAVFVVVYVLSATRVASQCTTRHCNEDDSEIEADVLTMVLGLRQRLAKQEETILSMNATIHSQNQNINELQEVIKTDNVRYDDSLKQLLREITALKEAQRTGGNTNGSVEQEPRDVQNTSCCASVERLQLEISSMQFALDIGHNNTIDHMHRELSSMKETLDTRHNNTMDHLGREISSIKAIQNVCGK